MERGRIGQSYVTAGPVFEFARVFEIAAARGVASEASVVVDTGTVVPVVADFAGGSVSAVAGVVGAVSGTPPEHAANTTRADRSQ